MTRAATNVKADLSYPIATAHASSVYVLRSSFTCADTILLLLSELRISVVTNVMVARAGGEFRLPSAVSAESRYLSTSSLKTHDWLVAYCSLKKKIGK